MSHADQIRKSLMAVLQYAYGRRIASDMDSWRSPGRMDFFVSSIVAEAGGNTEVPIGFAEEKAKKLGFTWDESFLDLLQTRLAPYGLKLVDKSYSPKDYSVKKTPWGSAGNGKTAKLRAKTW